MASHSDQEAGASTTTLAPTRAGVPPLGRSDPPRDAQAISATRGKRNGALDGLRGLAVLAVMAYHVVPDPFTGGWLGVDIFLVLSGFLICSMLLREKDRSNRIDYKRFLLRRARRLIPGLALMLVAILALAMVYESAGRRKDVAIDVMSSAFQVSNWRLILANESYFANVSVPSPIRHTWSLGVQEQFYFVFPLVLIFLFAKTRSARTLIVFFTALSAFSLWRMLDLYVAGVDPSRVYFGTDTRLFELLIGVVGAIVLYQRSQVAQRRRTAGSRGWGRGTEKFIAWLGLGSLLLIVYWMFTVNEFSPWLFQGGLALVALMTMVIITAATSPHPNVMTRILATRPLMKTGDMSYSLYLWHWPIIVYLAPALPSSSETTRQLAAVALTVIVSFVSYRLVERPIHENGLRGLSRTLPLWGVGLAVAAAPVIVGGAVFLWMTPGHVGGNNLTVRLPADPNYGVDPEKLDPETPRQEVVLLGASTVSGLTQRGDDHMTPDIQLKSVASIKCSSYVRDEMNGEELRREPPGCQKFRAGFVETINWAPSSTVVWFLPTRLFTDFVVDGERVSPSSAAHDAVVTGILDQFHETSLTAGAARTAVVNISCHDRPDFGTYEWVTRSNDIEATQRLNRVVSSWADRNNVAVYDNYEFLCPDGVVFDNINGVPLYDDGLHYTKESSPIIWQWLANEVREHIASER